MDELMLKAIETLSAEVDPAVRLMVAAEVHLLVANAPDTMWVLLDRFCRVEDRWGLVQAAVHGPSTSSPTGIRTVWLTLQQLSSKERPETNGGLCSALLLSCWSSFISSLINRVRGRSFLPSLKALLSMRKRSAGLPGNFGIRVD
jgi:hypothetical protein